MPTLAAVALAALLSACGGGSGPKSTSVCVPLDHVRIQLFGDSTQAGYDGGTLTLATITPAIALQAALDAEFGAEVTHVTVRAVPGTNSTQLLAGTDGLNQPWPRSVDADIVVINHGINDLISYSDVARYQRTLRQLAVSSSARVTIFETPNIVKGWNVGLYADAMREVAAEVGAPVADTYDYTASLPNWQTLIADWAHPNAELYQEITSHVVGPIVASQVRALKCKSP